MPGHPGHFSLMFDVQLLLFLMWHDFCISLILCILFCHRQTAFFQRLLKREYPEPSIVLQIQLYLLHFNYPFSLDYFLRRYFQDIFLTIGPSFKLLLLLLLLCYLNLSFLHSMQNLSLLVFQISPFIASLWELPNHIQESSHQYALAANLFIFFITLAYF